MLTATFVRKDQITSSVASFWFKPNRQLRFIAGQFIQITLPHASPDDRGNKRWFTISSSPFNELISITTRSKPSYSTFKQALCGLESSTQVTLSQPIGDFVLPKNKDTPLVFVAIGIGGTPFHSILKYLQDIKEVRDIKLIYLSKPSDHNIFDDAFSTLKENLIVVTKNTQNTANLTDIVINSTSDAPQSQIYLSGPERHVKDLGARLIKQAISSSRIRTDYFLGY